MTGAGDGPRAGDRALAVTARLTRAREVIWIGASTRVWVSNYGESSGARVTGARFAEWGCVYITWEKDDG